MSTNPTDKSYATDALKYWGAGWQGILPVPPKRKDPLPTGFSGHDGAYPDRDQIKHWIEKGFSANCKDGLGYRPFQASDANLALRLPNSVIGIDVDAYDSKKGRECLAHAEELWGPLPPTVRSTSRLDGISGIRLYHIPPGTILREKLTFPELGLDGIEICQRHHRYVMAWPSVHPSTGRRYRWVDHDGNMAKTDYPLVNGLPFLPEKWVENLSRPPEENVTTRADAKNVVSNLSQGTPSVRVMDTLTRSYREIQCATGGRHDEALRAIGRLLRLNEEGEPGVEWAMGQLEDCFVSEISDRASQETAQSEWDRMLYGNRIHDKIASTPSDNKQLETILGKPVPSLEAVMRQRDTATEWKDLGFTPPAPTSDFSPEQEKYQDQLLDEDDDATIMGAAPALARVVEFADADDTDIIMGTHTVIPTVSDDGLDFFDRVLLGQDGSSEVARTDWGVKDVSALLEADEFEPEEPTVGRRDDGKCLFYASKVNSLVGPPESAKSWVAQYVASQEIRQGHSAMYLDFEDSDRGVVGRMRYLGLDREEIEERFLYSDPKSPLNTESAKELYGNLDLFRPTLVIVDGLGAVMAMHGHEMKDNTEYIRFFQLLLEPLTRSGAAVVIIDHVSKDADETGNYAIGAQAKLQMITGVQIKVQATKKFGRGKEGTLRLTINKDRPGGVRMNSEFRTFKGQGRSSYQLDYWATVFVDAREEPRVRITMRFENKQEVDAPNGEGQHQAKTAEVREFLRANPRSSLNRIYAGVTGNERAANDALSVLKLRGELVIEEGPRNAKLHTLLDPPAGPDDDTATITGAPL